MDSGKDTTRLCEIQFIVALKDIVRNRGEGANVDILILDCSKVYGTVPHALLLDMLESWSKEYHQSLD